MTRSDVAGLCMGIWRFEGMRLGWEREGKPGALFRYIDKNKRTAFDKYITEYGTAIENLHLNPAEDRLKKIAFRTSLEDTTIGEMCIELQMLCEVTIDELKRHVFVHVPSDKISFVSDPAKFFGASWEAYPSAQKSMESACSCYGFGEDTAAVFHSMGVLQVGLEALARELEIPFESEMWQKIIERIESELASRAKAVAAEPKGQAKDELLQFYSGTAIQFRYFKDAWRNQVAHFREYYDTGQAHTILVHVRDFMLALSKRVRE